MRSFKARARMSIQETRRRDTLNIASADPAHEWQLTFYDINPSDNVKDPGTGRTVTGVYYTEYDGTVVNAGSDGALGYNANYPFNDLTFAIEGRVTVRQVGPAVVLSGGDRQLSFDVLIA